MKVDELTTANLFLIRNDTKNLRDKDKSTSLPNVQPKMQIKIPEGAKQIGNYILGKSIGSGTFGKVHLGMHIPTGQKVAVKIIEKAKIQTKDVQRVKNQIEILRSTRHRNLIHLYEIIQTEKSLLLVTEYMSNGELFSYIVSKKKIPQEEACKIFHQIIDGVQYLHRIGITHRDLKPQNIMVDYDSTIKLIDFGLSRMFSKGQRLHSACGSPCYASPEMIEASSPYDPQIIDIWSCGVILYAMVCGTLPFMQTETSKLYKKIVAGAYRPIKGVSEQVKDLIQKILVTNPNKRIKIQQIKQHPWWNMKKYERGYGLYRDQRISPDEDIVLKASALGYDKKKIVESLENNQKNKQTGAYYILMKKLYKGGKPIPKYIGGTSFEASEIEYLFQSFTEEISETAIDSGECSAQMPSSNAEDPTCTCTQNVNPFEYWVLIGTKQNQKRKEEHNKNINSGQILIGYFNKKSPTIEEQNKKLVEEEESITTFKTERKKKKSQFYGSNNYKALYKGKLCLTETYSSKDPLEVYVPKSRKVARISTLDTLKTKQKTQNYNKSVNKFSPTRRLKINCQNLPKIVQIPFRIKNRMIQNRTLQKETIKNKKLQPILKEQLHTLS